MEFIKREGYLIDWFEFYKEGLKHNWNRKTILNKIDEGISILFSPEQQQKFWLRFEDLTIIERGKNDS